MAESEIRSLLKDWGRFRLGSVVWIEPRYGIEPGQPDTMVLLRGGFTPVELKCRPDVVASLRPAQRRWTISALRAGATCLAVTTEAGLIKACALELKRKGSNSSGLLTEGKVKLVDVEHFCLDFLRSCDF